MTVIEFIGNIFHRGNTIAQLREENAVLSEQNDDHLREIINLRNDNARLRAERDFHQTRSKEFQKALVARSEEMNVLRGELERARAEMNVMRDHYV